MEITSPTELKNTKSFFHSIGYSKRYRKDVHTLLNFGYTRVRSTINTNTHEPTITGRIAEEIEKGLEQLGLLPEEVLKPHYVVIAENSKISVTDPTNKKDKFIRFDIVILDNRKRPYQRYVIEAKRLRKDNFRIDKYCEEGIMRFVDEIYSSDAPEAVMAAFWQDESSNYWFDKLTESFEKEDAKMFVEESLTSHEVIPEIPDEWFSIHKRKSGNKIILFHILLDCL